MSDRIGIDLGGTKIDLLVLSAGGELRLTRRVPTPKTYNELVAAVADLAAMGRGVAGSSTAIGMGAPGSASPHTGLWRNCNIVTCNGRPFAEDLAQAIGGDFRIENDANCFALSEARDGAGRGHGVVACLTVGTGLGGGLTFDGKVRSGPNAESAEFGHMPLPWPDSADWPLLPCYCGKQGCAEPYVSATGLAADYRRATGTGIDARMVVARARTGEAAAREALARLQDRFARVLAMIVSAVDPDIFVIGGGLGQLPELVEQMPPLVGRHSFSREAKVKVARALHGETSGARGAARLWH